MLSMINPDHLSKIDANYNHGSQEGLHTGYYEQGIIQNEGSMSQGKNLVKTNLPPNGKTTTNFNPQYGK